MNAVNQKEALIEIKNLTKKFGNLLVLDDITESINEGEIIAIIGPSGGGKSTFLRCLNVLEDPTVGKVIFDGKDLTDLKIDINECRQDMGMVFQKIRPAVGIRIIYAADLVDLEVVACFSPLAGAVFCFLAHQFISPVRQQPDAAETDQQMLHMGTLAQTVGVHCFSLVFHGIFHNTTSILDPYRSVLVYHSWPEIPIGLWNIFLYRAAARC